MSLKIELEIMVEIMSRLYKKEFFPRVFSSIFLIIFLVIVSIIGVEAYKICTILLLFLLSSELELLFKKKRFFLFF